MYTRLGRLGLLKWIIQCPNLMWFTSKLPVLLSVLALEKTIPMKRCSTKSITHPPILGEWREGESEGGVAA